MVSEDDAAHAAVPVRERHLTVSRTARYHLLGAPSDAVRELWVVLHGYGQLAARFARHFAPIAGAERLVAAPEALSRFYVASDVARHAQARVGATWMTREDRLAEIADYVGYLDALERQLRAELPAGVPLHVVGFSQGAATACRWVAFGGAAVHRLVLWGGAVPDDLDLGAHGARLARARLTLVHGDADQFRTAAAAAAEQERLRTHAVPFQALGFAGGHTIDAGALARLAGLAAHGAPPTAHDPSGAPP